MLNNLGIQFPGDTMNYKRYYQNPKFLPSSLAIYKALSLIDGYRYRNKQYSLRCNNNYLNLEKQGHYFDRNFFC